MIDGSAFNVNGVNEIRVLGSSKGEDYTWTDKIAFQIKTFSYGHVTSYLVHNIWCYIVLISDTTELFNHSVNIKN